MTKHWLVRVALLVGVAVVAAGCVTHLPETPGPRQDAVKAAVARLPWPADHYAQFRWVDQNLPWGGTAFCNHPRHVDIYNGAFIGGPPDITVAHETAHIKMCAAMSNAQIAHIIAVIDAWRPHVPLWNYTPAPWPKQPWEGWPSIEGFADCWARRYGYNSRGYWDCPQPVIDEIVRMQL